MVPAAAQMAKAVVAAPGEGMPPFWVTAVHDRATPASTAAPAGVLGRLPIRWRAGGAG
jgi:hypothetical protein